jgi:hypothetical protein
MTTDPHWRDDAACLNLDPDLFFPIGTTGPVLAQIGRGQADLPGLPGAGTVPGVGA